MKLNGKQRSYLRALGHALRPLVQVGKEGMSDGVVRAIDRALIDHELIKIRLNTESPEERDEVAPLVATETGSEIVQTIGRTILLYRRHPSEPKINLPRTKA